MDDTLLLPHPYLEPAGRAVQVSRANTAEWLTMQREAMTQAGHDFIGFVKRVGSGPVFQYRQRKGTAGEHICRCSDNLLDSRL